MGLGVRFLEIDLAIFPRTNMMELSRTIAARDCARMPFRRGVN